MGSKSTELNLHYAKAFNKLSAIFCNILIHLCALICLIILIDILPCPVYCTDGDSAKWQVRTATQAEDIALRYTGFITHKGAMPALNNESILVTLKDDRTPFIHALINDRPIWHILFKQVPIAHPNNKDVTYYRDFSIFLDPESGRLLKIYARKNDSDSGIIPLPPPALAEKQMKNAGAEEYLGLPGNMPRITFIEAIRNVFGNPETAHEIIAVYVIDKQMNREPCPVWAIDLRGIPPVPTINPGGDEKVPVWQRNHFRTVIDAETGHQLFFNNVPQPESPPDK